MLEVAFFRATTRIQVDLVVRVVITARAIRIIAYTVFAPLFAQRSRIALLHALCTIDELAFEDCTNLESLYLPASVTSIGDQPDWDSPVADCPKLQAITVDSANPKYFSIDGVLYCKDNGCLLTYPSGKSGSFDTPDFVLEYASDAFRGCRNLTGIRLGANVTRKCAVKFEPVLG